MHMRKIMVICSAAVMTLAAALQVHAEPADVDTSGAYWFWFEHVGSSKIVRTDTGVSGNIHINVADNVAEPKGLTITLWIVIFNNPGECATPYACGDDADFGNSLVMPDVVYGGGNVVGASGNAAIGFHHKAGDNSGSIADIFFMPVDADGESFGLRDPRGAEVHYVIRFHGPKNAAAMPGQIQSYAGGCVFGAPYGYPFPTGPGDLALGPGDCQDVIFAVHPSPM